MQVEEVVFYVSWGISFCLVVAASFLRFFSFRQRLGPERSIALAGHARNPIVWRFFSLIACPRLSLAPITMAVFLVCWFWRSLDREACFPPRWLPSYVVTTFSIVSLVLLSGFSFLVSACDASMWTFAIVQAGLWAGTIAIHMLQEKKRCRKGTSQSSLLSQIGIVIFFEILAQATFDEATASIFVSCSQLFVSLRLLWPWIWRSVRGRRDKMDAFYTAIVEAGGEIRCTQEMMCTPSAGMFLGLAEEQAQESIHMHSVRALRAILDSKSDGVLQEDLEHGYMSGALSLGSNMKEVERNACRAIDRHLWNRIKAQTDDSSWTMDEEDSASQLIRTTYGLSEEDDDDEEYDEDDDEEEVIYANLADFDQHPKD